MKKKIFSLLALVCMTLTASAKDVPTYSLTKADGAEAHGTITFKVGETAVTSAEEGKSVTMTIAPNDGWVVNTDKVEGKWTAAEAKAPGRRTIDMEKDITLTFVSEDAQTRKLLLTSPGVMVAVSSFQSPSSMVSVAGLIVTPVLGTSIFSCTQAEKASMAARERMMKEKILFIFLIDYQLGLFCVSSSMISHTIVLASSV